MPGRSGVASLQPPSSPTEESVKLLSFEVTNYRSINDSSPIEVVDRTALVGRNESGKTSLLRVLASLHPAGSKVVFTLTRDFPRDRKRGEFAETLQVLDTTWELTDAEREKLTALYPRAAGATTVSVSRDYAGEKTWSFDELTLPDIVQPALAGYHQVQSAIVAAEATTPGVGVLTSTTLGTLKNAIFAQPDDEDWGNDVLSALAALRAAYAGANAPASPNLDTALSEIERSATTIAQDTALWEKAEKWLGSRIPKFVYLDEWDEVPGHYLISQYVQRVENNQQTKTDRMFAKLLKVADLDAAELQKLLTAEHEERRLLTDRASRVFTRTIKSLWTDRNISVEFAVDGDHFDVLVKDEDTDALVPLDERSRGFRWYFSFFVTFAADTAGGDKANAILLLDEPGLFLHATAQANLLRFFERLPNQIVYSTHSPFMIEPGRIDAVRTVNLVEGAGTTVTNDPTGDPNTLFPLQAALGYDLTQTLFVGTKNVVVEGVTDFWYLSTASSYLTDRGGAGLAYGIVITPAGGAQKAPYMVALLTSQNVRVVVLLDSEPKSGQTANDLIKQRIIRSDGVLFVGAAFSPGRKYADIEDLLGDDVYLGLVREAYAKELAGKALAVNENIPRIVPRVEDAFQQLGLAFAKTRPASLWMRKMATDPEAALPPAAAAQFSRLFEAVNAAVSKIEAADRKAFT